MPAPPTPFDQARFQVRLEWGLAGLDRVAPADVVIVVDVLRFSTTVTDAAAQGVAVHLGDDAFAVSINGARVAAAAAETGAVVLLGCLRNASAVARAVVGVQQRRQRRTSVAVIAAGERAAAGDVGSVRFAVEDYLGAGAVVHALVELGIDHTSPEAGVACEAFRGLRGAARHLLTASGSGQELIDRGLRDEVVAAAHIDAVDAVALLAGGVFRRA